MLDPLTEPNRIAFAGDWHANADYADRAVLYAKDQGADVLVHLGDFGYAFTGEFLSTVTATLRYAGLPLLFIDGNHEDHDLLDSAPIGGDGLRQITNRMWHLPRGFRWTWAGTRYVALGGAHSVDRPWRTPGTSWWQQETITERQAQTVIDDGPADVLICHDCPTGVTIPGIDDRVTAPPFPPLELMRSHQHRQLLRRVVDAVRPRWVWHGHYHQRYTQLVDLGFGPLMVNGLDCDGRNLDANVRVVNAKDMAPGR